MDNSDRCYTVITFAPIQGFIEKSRKLRDLYGSSYILSLLSWIICRAAEKQGYKVVSPAEQNVTQGMPNQIILKGSASKENIAAIKEAFNRAWLCLLESCREWIEREVTNGIDENGNRIEWQYSWHRDWQLWANHCWEFFAASGKAGESITDVRKRLNQKKNQRDWTGINWQGESSTLSGADAIAYPGLGEIRDPRKYNYQEKRIEIRLFYRQLSEALGAAFVLNSAHVKTALSEATKEERDRYLKDGSSFINEREELSIPELAKRLITHKVIVWDLVKRLNALKVATAAGEPEKLAWLKQDLNQISYDLKPDSFRDLSREKEESSDREKDWTGWFLGDGDSASQYFKNLLKEEEEERLAAFSEEMRAWGKDFYHNQEEYLPGDGRTIYAGGDDFLGVLYQKDRAIDPYECLEWFYTFKSKIWHKPERKVISASVGFVWAAPGVPQRDVLQHCRLAESSAKKTGRDRVAFRILFNSGNHLEWVCPWWLLDREDALKQSQYVPNLSPPLKNLIESYLDRNGGKNWTHFYQDIAFLDARHVFGNEKESHQIEVALGLVEIYFGSEWKEIIGDRAFWWNLYDNKEMQIFSGILGSPKNFISDYRETPGMRKALHEDPEVFRTFNDWVINLSRIGFYLTDSHESHTKLSV